MILGYWEISELDEITWIAIPIRLPLHNILSQKHHSLPSLIFTIMNLIFHHQKYPSLEIEFRMKQCGLFLPSVKMLFIKIFMRTKNKNTIEFYFLKVSLLIQ